MADLSTACMTMSAPQVGVAKITVIIMIESNDRNETVEKFVER
jgi:hypothetical protein